MHTQWYNKNAYAASTGNSYHGSTQIVLLDAHSAVLHEIIKVNLILAH
jgi:hypothetical protein